MDISVSVDEIQSRLPRQLSPAEQEKVETYILDAQALVDEAFASCGKNLDSYLAGGEHRERIYKLVITDIVAAPVLVGISRGLKSASSTTAHQSDSAVWDDTHSVSWGGVVLTDRHLDLLGIRCKGAHIRWSFPAHNPRVEVSSFGREH